MDSHNDTLHDIIFGLEKKSKVDKLKPKFTAEEQAIAYCIKYDQASILQYQVTPFVVLGGWSVNCLMVLPMKRRYLGESSVKFRYTRKTF